MNYKLFECLSMKEFDETMFKTILHSFNPMSHEQRFDDPNKLNSELLFDKKKTKYSYSKIMSRINEMDLSHEEWILIVNYIEKLNNIHLNNKQPFVIAKPIIVTIISATVGMLFDYFFGGMRWFSIVYAALLSYSVIGLISSRFASDLSGLKNLQLYIKMHKLIQ